MKLEDATIFTDKCFNGELASCSYACPFRLDIRSFMEKCEKGRWNPAYKALRNAVMFPALVAATCTAPCMGHCQRTGIGDEALDMSALEAAAVRYTKSRRPEAYVIPPKTEKIAVVGAGASGLSCALSLAQKRFNVTVFERSDAWGGELRSHKRFAEFDEEFTMQFSGVTAEFKYNTGITALDQLAEFDAVYIATGAGGTDFGLLEGWDAALMSTANPKVFLGGALTGADTVTGIAQGMRASMSIEVFLQIGHPGEPDAADGHLCDRYVTHEDVQGAPRVLAASADGYTEEEAKLEASRCMKCDCDKCLRSCEMLGAFKKKPKKIGIEVFTDTQANPPFSSHTLTRETYSCNMCGHCKQVCPESVDIGALLQLSRADRAQSANYPEALHDYWLREMDFSTGEASFFATPPGAGSCEYLFFPGCQLGAHNPAHVLRSYDFLLKSYNAGVFVGCCGAPAYWAGDTARMDKNIAEIRSAGEKLGTPKFVFACATCETMFASFMPEIERVSLYELLSESADISPSLVFADASVFDPCNARGDDNMQNAVRSLAVKSGAALTELPEKNRCCGYGGHMRLANPKLYDTITGNRAAAGDLPYIVYCANCREVFVSRGKECVHVLDLAFGLPDTGRVPAIDQKRANASFVKKELMMMNLGEEYTPEAHAWDEIQLVVSDEIAERADRKLIALSDVREAIYQAEQSGDKFVDDESGEIQCCMEKPVLTYWVRYKALPDGVFELLDTYYHRMRIGKEDA